MICIKKHDENCNSSFTKSIKINIYIFVLISILSIIFVWIPLLYTYTSFSKSHNKSQQSTAEAENLMQNMKSIQMLMSSISKYSKRNLTEKTFQNFQQEFESICETIQNRTKILESYHVGNIENVQRLNELLDKLIADFDKYVTIIGEFDYIRAETHLITVTNPLIFEFYNQIKIVTDDVDSNLNMKAQELKEYFLFESVIFVLIILVGLLLLILCNKKVYQIHHSLWWQGELLKELWINLEEVYFVTDGEKITYVTDNVESILGFNKGDCLTNFQFLFKYMAPEIEVEIQENWFKNVFYETETEFLNLEKDKKLWVKFCLQPFTSINNCTGYIIVISDRTEIKLKEDNMHRALDILEKAMEVKDNFLSKMSHEIRTPIHSIMGLTTLAEGALKSQELVGEYLEKINRSSKYLLSLVNNILDEEKLEHGKMVLMKENFYLPYFIGDICEQISALAETKNLDFQYYIDKDIQDCIIGDSMRLYQILMNLCSNALKFTPCHGKVLFEIKQVERLNNKIKLEFVVSDSGIGMNQEFLKKLYEPFEQENSGIGFREGTGLGMSITKSLVELMNGEIKVESILGKGTKFSVILTFDIYDTFRVIEDKSNSVNSFSNLYGKHMLIVEDNEVNLDIMSSLLKSKGIIVDETNMGSEAIYKFINSPLGYYSIILLDIQLPDIDGFVVTETIRTSSHIDADRVVILAMSADMYSNDHEMLLQKGINGYISKPIDVNTLYRILSDMVR